MTSTINLIFSRFCTQAAGDSFCISDEITNEATQSLDSVTSGWVPGRFRLTKSTAADDGDNQLAQGIYWDAYR